MSKWLVYGSAWFAMTVDTKSESDARMVLLNRLMELDGVRFDVKELEAEPE